jgi:hypothetical protein
MTWTTREKVLGIALIAVIIVATTLVLMSQYRIHSTGKIKAVGVGVYWDPSCASPCTEIDWGYLSAGDLVGVTVYIKNTKNVNCTLSISSDSWEPLAAEQYLTLDWNYSGGILEPEQIISTQLTLYAALDIAGITEFSFDIIITATET